MLWRESNSWLSKVSFDASFLVSAIATPLALTPARDITPSGTLTGRPVKALNVATLDIPEAMLNLPEQAFSHISQPNILVYFLYFFLYLFLLFEQLLVSYFGLYLDDRLEGPKEEPLGDLDICYNLSSFLGSYEKMADIDINSFWWSW